MGSEGKFVLFILSLVVSVTLLLVWATPKYANKNQAALQTRDVFAIHAMEAISNAVYLHKMVIPMKAVAKESYRMADAMLEAREKDFSKPDIPPIQVEVCPDGSIRRVPPAEDKLIDDASWRP